MISSELLQGYSKKSDRQLDLLKCPDCGSLHDEAKLSGSCYECDSHIAHKRYSTQATVDYAICSNCSSEVLYTRDNEIGERWEVPGYYCRNCTTILEVKSNGQFVQPEQFLNNSQGSGFEVQAVNSERTKTVAEMFSWSTKVEGVGFWSYQPDSHRVWLASLNNCYCGFVTLDDNDKLIQIWTDPGVRRQDVATMLLEYICETVLPADGELWMNKPTDQGKELFKSLIDSDDKIFGRKVEDKYVRKAIRL
ncbi:GNAT family N-acetyltransferase [Halobellus clavatus]|uniref:N-acetyltransferase domain-containing protein n=1 Tax=Halobellus clavatus TaxID=660517 RepID=A0A1H3DIJ4_9EURY|nr:GNAT family N-acetyltransferase [Halobellus clavatus]SDX66332.1 hypothetical protein SAMN04487946_101603 [Halobellus clavatus]